MRTCFLVGLITFAAGAVPLLAQVPTAAERLDEMRNRPPTTSGASEEESSVPELYPGETGDTGKQIVLRMEPRRKFFEVSATTDFFYTDNMFLEENDPRETWVFTSTVEAALAPDPYDWGPGKFLPRLGYRHQWFVYGFEGLKDPLEPAPLPPQIMPPPPVTEFDFNAQTVFAEARYLCGNWLLEAGVDWSRLMESEEYTEFYVDYAPFWGVRRLIPVDEWHSFQVGYAGRFHFAELRFLPDVPEDITERLDHVFSAAYTWNWNDRLLAQPYYRFKYTDFTRKSDWEDCLHSTGISVQYLVTRWLSARVFVAYDAKESTNPGVDDYTKIDAGGGLTVNLRF